MVGDFVIAACNVGATVAGTGATSYGHYFQRGNNYGFPNTGTVTTSATLVSNPVAPYSRSTFVTTNTTPFDRATPQNGNLRGNTGTELQRK